MLWEPGLNVGKSMSLHESYALWYGHVCNGMQWAWLAFHGSSDMMGTVQHAMPRSFFFYVQQGESGV